MVTSAASVRSDPDLTEGHVNLLISCSATWNRAENVVAGRGKRDTSYPYTIFQVFPVFKSWVLSFWRVHQILETI